MPVTPTSLDSPAPAALPTIGSAGECASIDLGGSMDRDAAAILEWPDRFVATLKRRLPAIYAQTELPADDVEELAHFGLLDGRTAKLTPFGENLAIRLLSETWQEGNEMQSFLARCAPAVAGAVLEVGCGTGFALRSLRSPVPASRFGVDLDPQAVALGYRSAKQENQDVHFHCGSAHKLPFPDRSIDLIICCNSLTYMHQRTAVAEMTRVLKPQGFMFVRFENVWFDLNWLSHPESLGWAMRRLRDLSLGIVHAMCRWQPMPGPGMLRGARAFATVRGLTAMLRRANCEVVHVAESRKCPRRLGFATQTSLLAAKTLG